MPRRVWLLVAGLLPEFEDARQDVVTVRKDHGRDLDGFSDRAFDGEPASVDGRLQVIDDHAMRKPFAQSVN